MKTPRFALTIIILVVFLLGIGIIIYQSRPVMDQSDTQTTTDTTDDQTIEATDATQTASNASTTEDETDQGQDADPVSNQTPDTSSNTAASYTMANVEAHDSSSDCWTAINANVYDVSDWVSRHPGGPEAIMSLCGTDGSNKFNGQHTGFAQAESTLILFKIGTLGE